MSMCASACLCSGLKKEKKVSEVAKIIGEGYHVNKLKMRLAESS